MSHKARSLLISLGLVSLGVLLVFILCRQLFIRGVQGEAKLMIGYLHTLERVYRLENKRYEFWDEYYGSNQLGVDSCAQPDAAAEVGFLLPGCHRESAPPLRYAYRVMKYEGDRYRIEAKSGSDSQGKSVVCFDATQSELWESSQNMEFKRVLSCN